VDLLYDRNSSNSDSIRKVGSILSFLANQIGPDALASINNGLVTNQKISPLITKYGSEFIIAFPDAVAVTFRSNVLSYGPWVTNGPPGTVVIEQDDGLSPWEYGSFQAMDIAGTSRSNDSVTAMQAAETGSIQIPGYPTLPLGAELG